MSTETNLELEQIVNCIDKFNGFMELYAENTKLEQLCEKYKQDLEKIHGEMHNLIADMNKERSANNLVNMAKDQLIA